MLPSPIYPVSARPVVGHQPQRLPAALTCGVDPS